MRACVRACRSTASYFKVARVCRATLIGENRNAWRVLYNTLAD